MRDSKGHSRGFQVSEAWAQSGALRRRELLLIIVLAAAVLLAMADLTGWYEPTPPAPACLPPERCAP